MARPLSQLRRHEPDVINTGGVLVGGAVESAVRYDPVAYDIRGDLPPVRRLVVNLGHTPGTMAASVRIPVEKVVDESLPDAAGMTRCRGHEGILVHHNLQIVRHERLSFPERVYTESGTGSRLSHPAVELLLIAMIFLCGQTQAYLLQRACFLFQGFTMYNVFSTSTCLHFSALRPNWYSIV